MITLLSVTAFVYFSLILICFVQGLVTLWMTATTESKPTAQLIASQQIEQAHISPVAVGTLLAEDLWEASVVEPLILLTETPKPPQLLLPAAKWIQAQELVRVPTIRELKAKAKEQKIKNYGKLTKAQLLQALAA